MQARGVRTKEYKTEIISLSRVRTKKCEKCLQSIAWLIYQLLRNGCNKTHLQRKVYGIDSSLFKGRCKSSTFSKVTKSGFSNSVLILQVYLGFASKGFAIPPAARCTQ